jgi:hypothetical protein
MSKKSSQPQTKKDNRYKWIGHINVYFNDDELQEVIEFLHGRAFDCEDVIATITQKSCSVKFTYDQWQDSYYCTIQPKLTSHYLYGYTCGISHVDLTRLVGIALYVVDVLLENEGIQLPLLEREAYTF